MSETAGDDFTLGDFRRLAPADRLEHWRQGRAELAESARTLGERDRVRWYGPSMGAKSFVTARLMEAWAHGTDVCDTVGADREPTHRLRHVAQLGCITRAWTYVNRGEPPPETGVLVELTAPSGETWTWGGADTANGNTVRGPALDFCLVVTQRRHVADTGLEVTGEHATDWLSKAQAFAGPPTDGPSRARAVRERQRTRAGRRARPEPSREPGRDVPRRPRRGNGHPGRRGQPQCAERSSAGRADRPARRTRRRPGGSRGRAHQLGTGVLRGGRSAGEPPDRRTGDNPVVAPRPATSSDGSGGRRSPMWDASPGTAWPVGWAWPQPWTSQLPVTTPSSGSPKCGSGVAPAMISVLCLPKMRRSGRGHCGLPARQPVQCFRSRPPRRDQHGRGRGETSTHAVESVVADLLAGGPSALAAAKQLLDRVP